MKNKAEKITVAIVTGEGNPMSSETSSEKKVRVARAPQTSSEKPGSIKASSSAKRNRTNRPFPAGPFNDALDFAKQVYEFGSGQPVRRLTLFDHLQRTPDSGPSRQLITNSNKYGLIKGSYASDQLELTIDGKKVCDEGTNQREIARLKAKLAIQDISPFDSVYQRFVNAKLPARAALVDAMRENGVEIDHLEEGVDTFIVNLKAVGLLQTLSGAERVVPVDHLMDIIPSVLTAQFETGASNVPLTGQNLGNYIPS
jgi:hypothetical protein